MRDTKNDELDLESRAVDESLIKDLERQSIDQIRTLRAHERVEAKVRVVLQPGNSSQLRELRVQGVTADISEGGCSAVFPVPVMVGDVFRLQFDPKGIDLPLVFARALRCRMLREEAFEVGFRFFSSVRIKKPSASGGDLLD